MASPPLGIYDSFNEQGLFWLPDKRDDEVPGTLSYDPENGAVLKLLGIFGKLHEAVNRALGGARDNAEAVIHGVTMKGKPISLLHAFDTSRQLNMPGIPHE
ncbi:hypothetical protein ACHWGL_30070, partial [Klebsiella pneumoniae]|uniref:ApeA N-terminal domain 1-containing protein n=1 Tax=Klebsiella pneumoniae TaxID=573 RepID=UPI00376EDDB8